MSAPDPIGGIAAQIDVLRAIMAIDLSPEEAAALRTLGALLHRFGTVLLGCAEAVAIAARPVRDAGVNAQAFLDAMSIPPGMSYEEASERLVLAEKASRARVVWNPPPAQNEPASPAPDAPAQAAPAGVSRALDVSSQPAPAAVIPDRPRAAFSGEEAPKLAWTPARDAHLKKRWVQFVTQDVIRAELAAMPGLPLPSRTTALGERAATLHVKRPVGFRAWHDRQKALRDAAPSVAAAQLAADAARQGVADSDWRGAMDWSHRHGVTLGAADEDADLVAVNARRAECGLPPFRILPGRGPSRALPATHLSA